MFDMWLSGEVMIHHRENFSRVYDFRENIAPPEYDYAASEEEAQEYDPTLPGEAGEVHLRCVRRREDVTVTASPHLLGDHEAVHVELRRVERDLENHLHRDVVSAVGPWPGRAHARPGSGSSRSRAAATRR